MNSILKAWLIKRPIAWVAIFFVALSVFVNVVVFSVTEGMTDGFINHIRAQYPDLMISHYDRSLHRTPLWEEEDFRSTINQSGFDGAFVFELKNEGLVFSDSSEISTGAFIRGVTRENFSNVFSCPSVSQQEIDQVFQKEKEVPVILSRELAHDLRLGTGDSIEFFSYVPSSHGEVVRRPRKKQLKATVSMVVDFTSKEDQHSAFIPLKEMQLFMNRYGPDGQDREVARALLRCSNLHQAKQVAEKLNTFFSTKKDEYGFYYASAPTESQRWIQQIYNEMIMVRSIVVFVILLAACAVFLMIHLLMKSKVKTLGLLMAMGVSSFRLFKMVICYGLFLSVVGSVIGWWGGSVFMDHIDQLEQWLIVDVLEITQGLFGPYGFDEFPSAYSHQLGFSLVLGSVILCSLAALIPAFFATRLQPADVLKNE